MINLYLDVDGEDDETIKKNFDLPALPKSVILDENLFVRDNHFKRASRVTAADMQLLLRTNAK